MSRMLFMAKLKEGLAGLPQPEIDEITSDYEYHFAEGAAAGQSEDDIVARLGDPMRLSRELRGDLEQRRSTEPVLMQPPAAAAPVSVVSSLRARLGLLLAVMVVMGAAAIAYQAVYRGVPSSVVSAKAPLASRQQAPSAPAMSARIVISGGQTLDLGTIAQERIEITLDGGGHAAARGRVKDLTLYIDGSGSGDFGALEADIVHVEVSGTGNAEVSATQMADITISGSGTVRLKNRPKTLKQSVTGSGKVILPS